MKVVHICPTHFSSDSVMAGAERYSYDLAIAMAKKTRTTLVTFGPKSFVRQVEGLIIQCFKPLLYVRGNKANPFSVSYLGEVLGAGVIHCHQLMTITTDLAILLGSALRKRVFVTDLGGGTEFSLSYHLPLWKGIRSLLLISEFNRDLHRNLPIDVQVIYGGVDTCRFSPDQGGKLPRILHVGRILPHKGIHDLLDALPEGVGLDIVGQPYDHGYYRELQEKARGKDVVFYTDLGDDQMIERYRRSFATVLPATADSGFTTALESFACGTPVIATEVGSLPEIVEHGVTGFLVPPNKPTAIREKIEYLRAHPDVPAQMGKRAREEVLKRFTWDAVADRCLEIYGSKTREVRISAANSAIQRR